MKLPLVLVLGVVAGAVSFNQRMLDPLTLLIARELAIAPDRVVLLATIFLLPYALGQLFLGPLADAIGKARVLRICIGALILSTLASAWATNYPILAALRFLAGLAAGGCIPVGLALIADRTPPATRQVAFSRFMIVMTLAQLMTSPISAAIALHVDWHGVLLASVMFCTAAFGLLLWQIKPNPALVRQPLSFSRAAQTFQAILSIPRARVCFLAVFAEGLLIFGFIPHLALYLEQSGMGSIEQTSYVLAAIGCGGLVFAASASLFVSRFNPFLLMGAGGGLIGVGLVAAAMASTWYAMVPALFLVGFSFYLLHSGIQAQVTEVMVEARSSVVSLHAFSLFMGLAAGPMVFGWVSGLLGFAGALIVAGALISLASMLAARALAPA